MILKSVKQYGLQGHQNPLIIIVKRDEVPRKIKFKTDPPLVTIQFDTKTYLGIVAGAHRLFVLRLFYKEAGDVLAAAGKYILALHVELESCKGKPTILVNLKSTIMELMETVGRLKVEQENVGKWPVLIHDWGR